MNKNLDGRLKELLTSELDTVEMSEEADRRVLAGIHQQMHERRTIMRYPKKRMIVAIAAAIAVTGTITAIAAGRIAGLVSSTNRNEAILSVAELEEKAGKHLGSKVYIADTLSDGTAFTEGYIEEVNGVDEAGNQVASYPEVDVSYGEVKGINLSIHRPVAEIPEVEQQNQQEEEYQGILLGVKEDNYLFLPPDAKPSEEDQKLEAEGRLYISYGSSEEQREVFRNVSWTKDGLNYLLYTYGDKSVDELLEIAKAYIDGAQ